MSLQTPPKKKRIKRVYRHPNLLFEKWLQEWCDEAKARDSQMKFNYARAIKSLKSFPLPLYRGADCKVLSGFGDKICQQIDRRLEKHIQEFGPINWDEYHQVVEHSAPRKKRAKKISSTHTESNSSDAPNNEPLSKSGKKRCRPYVPAMRSGAYAILMAFNQASSDDGFPDNLKRTEVIEKAQEFCDASFTQAPDGSHYTAWSSMSTLLKKNLITREGCPARYALTLSGEDLCNRLVSAENGTNSQESLEHLDSVSDNSCEDLSEQELCKKNKSASFSGNTKKSTESITNQRSSFNNTEMDKMTSSLCSNGSSTKNLQDNWSGIAFSYINEQGMETPQKDRAVISLEEDGLLGFLIKCRLTQLLTSDLNYVLDNSRDAPVGFTYAFLDDAESPNIAPGLHSPTKHGLSFEEKKIISPQVEYVLADTYPKQNDKKRKSGKTTRKEPVSKKKSTVKHATGDTLPEAPQSMISGTSSITTLSPELSQTSTSSQVSIQSSSQNSGIAARSMSSTQVQPQFCFPAGTYELLLCVDNAEVVGGYSAGKKNQKDIIISELRKHGVTFDVRKLHVGDFLWVAREKQLTYGGTGALSQPRELVLPYVIERKRMDDLASSIKDGRFREQKFRLKQSGLSRPMYLVEQYGSQNSGLPESTCEQAVVNTQVVDEFMVKWTKDQRESAAFLTIMTRSLQSLYQGKTLDGISKDHLSQEADEASNFPFTSLYGSAQTSLLLFTEFNAASMKHRQLSVREMFAKQLLQLHGLSVDKAKAITDLYPTPSTLISAYSKLYTQEEREQLLSAVKSGKLGKAVGQTISANIARLYTNQKIL